MSNPVTTSDLAARLGRSLTPAETTLAQALLDDAWAILTARNTTIDARLTAATLDPALVRAVETAMVLRVLRNPDGKKQEAIDDYSWTRDTAISSGALYVSDEELALLSAPYTGTTRGSVRLVAYGEL
jgi:hypothetical protein